ncbi:hypothetical protein [Nitrosomonas sp.]|uniref:hypothetical protein n=1 Tax=Nitrosomonas sp. TaxID=42353 RepID=UPI0025D2DFC4|nr:hypothetical protein [Nitrosomonas sp.]
MKKYVESKILEEKLFLDDGIHEEISSILNLNAESLKRDVNYTIYISLQDEEEEILWEGSYRYQIPKYVLDALTVYQSASYKLPKKYSNKFYNNSPTIYLREEKDKNITKSIRTTVIDNKKRYPTRMIRR